VTIENFHNYAGCKSWVPLEKPIEFSAMPAIDDATFEERRGKILSVL